MRFIRFVCMVCMPVTVHCLCTIESMHHSKVDREMLMAREQPLLVKDAAKDWQALKTWDRENLIKLHGDEAFHTDPWHGNTSVKHMLTDAYGPDYRMGHVVGYGDCYQRGGREYSPFLQTRAKLDYKIEEWMKPMKVFHTKSSAPRTRVLMDAAALRRTELRCTTRRGTKPHRSAPQGRTARRPAGQCPHMECVSLLAHMHVCARMRSHAQPSLLCACMHVLASSYAPVRACSVTHSGRRLGQVFQIGVGMGEGIGLSRYCLYSYSLHSYGLYRHSLYNYDLHGL